MINESNYFSKENNQKYMSVSQFKSFMDCEAKALAEVKGEYTREKTTALLIGSYVDAYFEGTLANFQTENEEIFTKKGDLKSEFRHAEYIIARIEKEPFMLKYLAGEKQVIKTGEIAGVPFKTKIDSYHEGKAIVDLKIMKDMKKIWKDGLSLNFVEAWNYDLQGAVYQKVEGNNLPFFLAVATKEKPEPDLAMLSIPQDRLDYCLQIVKEYAPRFQELKNGIGEPTRCEQCDYCRRTKVLSEILVYNWDEVSEA